MSLGIKEHRRIARTTILEQDEAHITWRVDYKKRAA